ncbi:4-hydroxybenzoate 3-monooxygenase [Nakamurella deserti]|uniref:4-hydroxybenzoate 3-monooxygenase n=1 Tax=Nakamurella deserti TaxID=2164074 RepID=UPI000DBE3FF7|nr:4-hydroxybenzoate 3-monooxygenase [Nakamurella deserti]
MRAPSPSRTAVGIVGGGPAGLMLAHLLRRDGIDSVVIDTRPRTEIGTTHRAGILERDSARLLVDSGVSDRVLTDGHEHRGIDLRYGGESHRIDFTALAGTSVWLYPQTDVFLDLADAADRDGGDVRFGVADTEVTDVLDRPRMAFTDADGVRREISCDYVVGADGSRGVTRHLFPETDRRRYAREYPFGWLGILCAAPPSAPELIYARSDQGFALISRRTDTVQRMYLQCDPATDVADWPDDRIWEELQRRLAGPDGFRLQEGPILERTVLPFRSFVQEPMRYGNLLLAGDAAHTVPPTGAKGLNLALADVRVLAEHLAAAVGERDPDRLDGYTERALARVWKTQHFSYWMTTMLHTPAGADAFDLRRQLGELDAVTSSEAGSRYLAEGYTGWPTG